MFTIGGRAGDTLVILPVSSRQALRQVVVVTCRILCSRCVVVGPGHGTVWPIKPAMLGHARSERLDLRRCGRTQGYVLNIPLTLRVLELLAVLFVRGVVHHGGWRSASLMQVHIELVESIAIRCRRSRRPRIDHLRHVSLCYFLIPAPYQTYLLFLLFVFARLSTYNNLKLKKTEQ